MVTRDIDAFDPALVTVASIHGGTAGNIIPETATLVGTIRAVSEGTREKVHHMITRVADGIANAHGCTAEVDIIRGYPVTVNDAAMVRVVEDAVAAVLGEGRYMDAPTPIMGSEDFSYILQRVPGAMMGLGLCPAGYDNPFEAPSLHSNRAMLNEDGLPVGVAMHAAVAMAR
jgi:hippurate hydrolase